MTSSQLDTLVRRARVHDLSARELYRILRLRVDVFVMEQDCAADSELDGRDLEPTTLHVWLDTGEQEHAVTGYLRVLDDPGGIARIGRVCTARLARGRGVARAVMQAAIDEVGDRPIVLSAQSYALGFYQGFGFVAEGEEYLDEGIPHVDMRREPTAS